MQLRAKMQAKDHHLLFHEDTNNYLSNIIKNCIEIWFLYQNIEKAIRLSPAGNFSAEYRN